MENILQRKVVMTGDRPTGPLHLGHYVGSLVDRIKLQKQQDKLIYIMVADTQALTDNFSEPEKVVKNVYEVVKDYLSVGIDPNLSTIFIQSQIGEIAELAMYYLNLVTIGRLERNPTVKNEIAQKGFGDSIPAGFFCYPVSQAADITAFKGQIIPVGDDQIPMLEQTNEIVRRFNRLYNTCCLVECAPYIDPLSKRTARLVGIDGNAKASKSLNNAIFLSDSTETVKEKVRAMFTDPSHLRISDPGKVEGNVVFSYLDAFHPDQDEITDLKIHYQKGGLGDSTIKNILINTLEEVLQPIREKRNQIEDAQIREILKNGTDMARKQATETLQEVKEAMSLCSYFSSI